MRSGYRKTGGGCATFVGWRFWGEASLARRLLLCGRPFMSSRVASDVCVSSALCEDCVEWIWGEGGLE